MTSYQQEISRSFRTIQEMLRDRGIDEATVFGMSNEDALAYANGRYSFHIDDALCGYRIVYELNPKFKLNNIRKLLDPPPEHVRVFLVIVREMPTAAAMKSINDLKIDIQFFDIRELQFNISKHDLVPKHDPIREEGEAERIVRDLYLRSRHHLPLILSSDPMARYLGLKPGHLVRITRCSPSSGTYVFYRCCVKAT